MSGCDVDVSMKTLPLRAPASRPFSPVMLDSTSALPVTQMKTTSLAAATAAKVGASTAPAAIRSSTGSRRRKTASERGKPFASRFLAIPWPIIELAPMKPTRSDVSLAGEAAILLSKVAEMAEGRGTRR